MSGANGTGSLGGVVVSELTGEELAGAELVLYSRRLPAPHHRVETSNAAGRYDFRDLPQGTYTLFAAHGARYLPGFYPHLYVVNDEKTQVNIALQPVQIGGELPVGQSSLGGVVVSELTGVPLEGVELTLYCVELPPQKQRSNAEGRYDFTKLPAGTYTLTAIYGRDFLPGIYYGLHVGPHGKTEIDIALQPMILEKG